MVLVGYESVEVHVVNDGGHAGVQVTSAFNDDTAYMRTYGRYDT